jgi:hypothetical protein
MSDVPEPGSNLFESPAVVLWWLPVGAGAPTRISGVASGWWESLVAWRERRPPMRLVHSALEVYIDDLRYVIEMAPEWSDPHVTDRGVVAQGPVGLRILGRSRFFRYEVRCWRDGELSDCAWAVGEPVMVSRDEAVIRAVLRHVADVPPLIWGRPVATTGDMWNSNSLVAWLLSTALPDASLPSPPEGCRAPGWAAGLAVARRQRSAREQSGDHDV